MDKELFDVYCADTNGKRINKPIISKSQIEVPKDICPKGETTYKLGERMTWEEFKAMPKDLKIEYIDLLKKHCGIKQEDLANAFGVALPTLRGQLNLAGYCNKKGWKRFKDPIESAKWQLFLDGKNYLNKKPDCFTEVDETEPQNPRKTTLAMAEDFNATIVPVIRPMTTEDVTIRLSGEFNPTKITERLSGLFDIGQKVSVMITICNEETPNDNP